MTRWARANNAHKRQPSDPSSWNELRKSDSKPNFKRNSQSNNDWRDERRFQSKQRRQEKRKMKTCYNCRSTSHAVADCPNLPTTDAIAVGVCFKCGSTEHRSHACRVVKKSSEIEFPFASCFVCGQKGHLSSTCPKNATGIFPRGGACHLCGSVRHLKKDCPQTLPIKKVEKKAETTVRWMKKDENVEKIESDSDEEEREDVKLKRNYNSDSEVKSKTKTKAQKIVKF